MDNIYITCALRNRMNLNSRDQMDIIHTICILPNGMFVANSLCEELNQLIPRSIDGTVFKWECLVRAWFHASKAAL